MIGKPLSERYGHGVSLAGEAAVAIVKERLGPDGAALVQVRAKDARMIACLVVRADSAGVRLCRELGLEMKPGGTGVVGLIGCDAARLLARLPAHQKRWLQTPCGPRETKVLLVAGGIALVSVEAGDNGVVVTPVT